VVKELVENSLDAGATRIEVEFRHGGRSLMRIEDNGHGMSRDDALLALERHATSKISVADDLNALRSFGFRGEALPSIASVSRFELQTRETSSDLGTEILVNGGKFVHVRDCGRPVGTRIEVTHLFNTVPARRKFLKTDATEAAHIIQGVRLYALAFPQVAFTLIEDGRVIFRSPECTTLGERISGIFGAQIAGDLLDLEAEEGGMRVAGLIGRPGQGRATRHEMITYINRRPVDSRALNYALIESYHESLPKGRYPLAFVFFEIDPSAVDVNVHPAKREVRFRNETAVRGFVIRTVLQKLRELGVESRPSVAPPAVPAGIVRPISASPPIELRRSVPEPASFPASSPSRPASALPHLPGPPVPVSPILPIGAEVLRPAAAVPGPSSAPVARSWRFVGLAHGTYALFETAAGLVLLDRRSAHERVWYERLRAQYDGADVASQRLLLPIATELDPIASAMLLDRLEFINSHGFEIAEFGRNFFRIEAVPTWMEPADAEPFLRDLLGALREGRLAGKDVDVARDEFARLAVARAVRLPEHVAEAECRALVDDLFACRTRRFQTRGC
jgi:DNA mismatch repair protein MutL